jgi:hypothetical protein
MNMKVTLATEISDHPLHKISEGIPARLTDFTHPSVKDYNPSSVSIWYEMEPHGHHLKRPFGANIPH